MTTSITARVFWTLVATVLGTGIAPAQIDTYTDRADWEAALGGAPDFEEDFSSFEVDTVFRRVPVAANGFTLVQTGSDAGFRNQVDVPPFQFSDNNGTSHASSFVDLAGGNTTNVLVTPDASLTAWGADFNGAGGNELLRFVVMQANGDETVFDPDHFDESGADRFWGFVVASGSPVVAVEMRAQIDTGSGGEGFAMDQVAGVFDPGVVVIDFETEDDFSTPLVNGQEVTPGGTFGLLVSVEGVAFSGLGAAIFDSDPAGPNSTSDDPDLLVDLGNVLILQEEPKQTVDGIYDDPDDDTYGGEAFIQFLEGPVTPISIDLVDIEAQPAQDARVTLFDDAGRTRTYTVPAGFTEDLVVDGAPGYRTLDLTTTEDQAGFVADATAEQDPDFDASAVLALEVVFDGSAALDNLVFAPASDGVVDAPEGYLLIGGRLGAGSWEGAGATWTTQVADLIAVVPFDPAEAPTIACAAAGLGQPGAGPGPGSLTAVAEVYVQVLAFDPDAEGTGSLASQVLGLARTKAGPLRVRDLGASHGLWAWMDVLSAQPGGAVGGENGDETTDDPVLRFSHRQLP